MALTILIISFCIICMGFWHRNNIVFNERLKICKLSSKYNVKLIDSYLSLAEFRELRSNGILDYESYQKMVLKFWINDFEKFRITGERKF